MGASASYAGVSSNYIVPSAMPYNKAATAIVLNHAGFSANCRAVLTSWFARWHGSELPLVGDLDLPALGAFADRMFITAVVPHESAVITYFGAALARAVGADLVGRDAFALATPRRHAERMRRYASTVAGAVTHTTHHVTLASGRNYFFEALLLPTRRTDAEAAAVIGFMDWNPPDTEGRVGSLGEAVDAPDIAQIIPLIDGAPRLAPAPETLGSVERDKIISRAVVRFLVNLAGDMMANSESSGLDPIDYLLASAVGSANLSHFDGDPALSRQHAGVIEADTLRRGISRAAIARATGLPTETVRRRINGLIEMGVLRERDDGIVLPQNSRFGIGARPHRMRAHAQMVERLFRDLAARGITFD
ncbi:MAG: winged helix-turn-helix domain-containing protein [Alphaproteobacteria bacterium]|nr:winged helix-turn-helix domain-containing protein [Alphaproteobacteria bacterium]MBL6938084.1 winged helix-turn-helix domain-containing protein [Alphaproteobacteria bacterium]MBL7099894.1 winged helix-turn-helix domain-containing protein [Alphaproteobacteria bacterium]